MTFSHVMRTHVVCLFQGKEQQKHLLFLKIAYGLSVIRICVASTLALRHLSALHGAHQGEDHP